MLLLILTLGCTSGQDELPPGAVDLDGDGFDDTEDCDDDDDDIYPGAPEHCDDVDEDCDGEVDESPVDGELRYPDEDGDGYGDEALGDPFCATPVGRIAQGGDCNDQDAAIHPEASEVCNEGIDDDCDGAVDDEDDSLDRDTRELYFEDADRDGYGNPRRTTQACAAPDGYVEDDSDCDDEDDAVSPDAEEICDDGIDNDCDDAALGCGLEGELSAADASVAGNDVLDMQPWGVVVLQSDQAVLWDGATTSTLGSYEAVALATDLECYVHGGIMDTSEAGSVNLVAVDCAVGDFDGDGAPEAAGAKASETDVYNADCSSLEARVAGGGRVEAVDVNVDGIADLLTLTDDGAAIWTGPLTSDRSLESALVTIDEVGIDGLHILDYTGDGHPDLAVGAPDVDDGANADAGAAWLFFGPIHDSYTSASATATIYGAAEDGVGSSLCGDDVDGDGDADLWLGGAAVHYLHLGPSAGTTDALNAQASMATSGGCGSADLDEDGKAESALSTGSEAWLFGGRGL